MFRRAATLGVLALALACGVAQADDGVGGTFLSGTCNGAADSACQYCSYHGSQVGEPVSYCYGGASGFRWTQCAAWAAGACHDSRI